MKRTLVLGLLAVSTAAHAESRAWNAAKKLIPAGMETVAGLNAASAHGSQLYQSLLPTLLAKAGDAATQLDGIKADCGIDVIGSIDSIAVGLDASQKGTIVVAFRGVTRGKLEACAQKRAKAKQKTLAITSAGALTKYSGVGDDAQLYMRWLGSDVVAIATSPDDKDATVAATAGGVTGDHALHGLGKVNTSASVWAVSTKQTDLPGDLGAKMTGMYGSADVASGTIGVDLHVAVDSPKAASDAATKAESELAPLRGTSGGIADLLKSVKVTAAGSEIMVTAQVPEAALMTTLAMFAH
jgi:hypothetical protein